MINKRVFFLSGLLIASMTTPLLGQLKMLKENGKKEYGVQYMLPKTYINIQIKEKKTVYKPGELCQYAERYLKLSNVPTTESTRWNFINAKIDLSAKPDSGKVFFVPMNEKTIAPLMELTPDGIIKSINMPLSAVTAGTVKDTAVVTNISKTIDPHSLLTEDILMAGSTSKMAELISKEIYNIRDSRNELVRGQADNLPKDGAQLKLMLDNLNAQEKALTSMFTGTYQYEEKTVTVPVLIKESDNEVAFRFSQAFGVVDKDDLSGRPFLLTIKKQESTNLHPTDSKKSKDDSKGVAYNIPGRALLILKDGDKKVTDVDYPVTQFGTVAYLAPTLFGKKSTVSVKFDPMTGGLLKVDRK